MLASFPVFFVRNPELEKWKHLGVSWQWKLFRSWKIIASSAFLKMFIEWKSCFSLENVRDHFLFHSSRSSHCWAWALFLHCFISVYFDSFPSNAPLPLCYREGWCHGWRISTPELSPHGGLTASSKRPGEQQDFLVFLRWVETTQMMPHWLLTPGSRRGMEPERGSELWNSGHVGFLPSSLPGTAQNFCAGSDGSLNPHVQLQNKAIILTTDPSSHPLSPALSCKDSRDPQLKYYGAMNNNVDVCLTPVVLVRIH